MKTFDGKSQKSRKSRVGRPKGVPNGCRQTDCPRKLSVSPRHADLVSQEAKKAGVSQRVYVETMIESYITAPWKHRMLANVLRAIENGWDEKKQEETHGGSENG